MATAARVAEVDGNGIVEDAQVGWPGEMAWRLVAGSEQHAGPGGG